MKLFKVFFCVTVLLLVNSSIFSQPTLNLHGSGVIPVLNFGNTDVDDENAGLAGLGVGLGMMTDIPIDEGKFGFNAGFDIIVNGLSYSAKQNLKDKFGDATILYPRYWNVPFQLGGRYNFYEDDYLKLSFNAAGLFSMFYRSDMMVKGDMFFDSYDTEEFSSAVSFGYNIGINALLNDRLSIGLKYIAIEPYDIEVTTYINNTPNLETHQKKLRTEMVCIAVGYNFTIKNTRNFLIF